LRRFAKRQKDAEEASKETNEDENVNEAEMASKEELKAVDAKATAEEAKVEVVEETQSESESIKSVKVDLTEQEKDDIEKDLLIVRYAELVKRKPTPQKT
jgi:hypothetical protein